MSVEIQLEPEERLFQRTAPGLIGGLRQFQRRIVKELARKLDAASLGHEGSRQAEFIGNQVVLGRKLERQVVVPVWGESDYAAYKSHWGSSDSELPTFDFAITLACGSEMGTSMHAHLYPRHGRREAVAEVCTHFNFLITIFDWLMDAHKEARQELGNVFGEDTLRRLLGSMEALPDLQLALASVRNPAVRVLLKTFGAFFTRLHNSARVPVSHPAWAHLTELLIQHYQAEIVTTELAEPANPRSDRLSATLAKSVLPFHDFLAIAVVCEDQPAMRTMAEASPLAESVGVLIAIADEVTDLVKDYRSGDANTILMRLGLARENCQEASAPHGWRFPSESDQLVNAVVNQLYDNLTRALSLVEFASDSSSIQHTKDAILGFAQGMLHLTELGQRMGDRNDEAETLKRALLTNGVSFGRGLRRGGAPCLMDCGAALLDSSVLDIATRRLWHKLRHYRPTAIGGVSLGADPLVRGLMVQAQSQGWPLKGFFIRGASKDPGLGQQMDGSGLSSNDRLAIVDDLMGGGLGHQHAAECIKAYGPQIVAAGVIVDLCGGGAASLRQEEIPVETLFTSGEMGMVVQRPLQPDAWKMLWSVPGIYCGTYIAPASSPSSAGDQIYLGSDAGYVACFTAGGQERWRFTVRDPNGSVHAKPLIQNGRVYFGAADGVAYCLDAQSGQLQWATRCASRIVSSPSSIAAEHKVFISGAIDGGGIVVCLCAETGRIMWRLETESPIESSPAIESKCGIRTERSTNTFVVSKRFSLPGGNHRMCGPQACSTRFIRPSALNTRHCL
jgi:orotate phosphoribosyltransferase